MRTWETVRFGPSVEWGTRSPIFLEEAMKATYGGHWRGTTDIRFEPDGILVTGQEYDLTPSIMEDLTTRFDVMFHQVDITSPPPKKRSKAPRFYQRMFYLDEPWGLFRQM